MQNFFIGVVLGDELNFFTDVSCPKAWTKSITEKNDKAQAFLKSGRERNEKEDRKSSLVEAIEMTSIGISSIGGAVGLEKNCAKASCWSPTFNPNGRAITPLDSRRCFHWKTTALRALFKSIDALKKTRVYGGLQRKPIIR